MGDPGVDNDHGVWGEDEEGEGGDTIHYSLFSIHSLFTFHFSLFTLDYSALRETCT